MEFTEKVGKIITNGWAAAGLAMGSRLGLFNGLADLAQTKENAVTTQQIADSMNMKERYIREWIKSMVAAEIIDHIQIDGVDRYWLATPKVATLVNRGSNLCPVNGSELFIGAVSNYPAVEKCFAAEGPRGTEVDHYPIFHEFLAKKTEHNFQSAAQIPGLINDEDTMTRLETGIRVLEVGCGAAGPTRLLAENYPDSTFTASDLSENVLIRAKEKCKDLSNVKYQILDACDIPDDLVNKFDLVMLIDVFHDVAYPDKLTQGMYKLLSPGGKVLISDIDMCGDIKQDFERDPGSSVFYYSVSTLYCMPTSLYYPDGAGLGACAGPTKIEKILREGGFRNVRTTCRDGASLFLCSKD